MSIWFTSDEHYGHCNILKYCDRPFNSIQHHDVMLSSNWNEVVSPDDVVYVLGDFTMNANFVSKVQELNGKKILVAGNHDRCFAPKDKNGRWKKFYLDAGFSEVFQEMRMEIAGEDVLLSHFPYQNAKEPDQRYFEYRPKDEGDWLLHGHTHNHFPEALRGKSYNVGVDVNSYYPVSLETISKIIQNHE